MHQLLPQDIPEIESWLETLFQCKQLDEDVIRKLCEKVVIIFSYNVVHEQL